MNIDNLSEHTEEQMKDVSGGAFLQTNTDNSTDNSINNSFNEHRTATITVQGQGNSQLIGSIDLSSGSGTSGNNQQTKIPMSFLSDFFNN